MIEKSLMMFCWVSIILRKQTGAGKLEIRISGGYPPDIRNFADIRRISGGGISNFPAQLSLE